MLTKINTVLGTWIMIGMALRLPGSGTTSGIESFVVNPSWDVASHGLRLPIKQSVSPGVEMARYWSWCYEAEKACGGRLGRDWQLVLAIGQD